MSNSRVEVEPRTFLRKTVFQFTVYHREDTSFTAPFADEAGAIDGVVCPEAFNSPLGLAMAEAFDGHAVGHETVVSCEAVPVQEIPEFFHGDTVNWPCPACGSNDVRFVPQQGYLPYECDDCGHLFA